jgi:hypothetical protein
MNAAVFELFQFFRKSFRRINFADRMFAYFVILAKFAVHSAAAEKNSAAAFRAAYGRFLVKMRSYTAYPHIVRRTAEPH